MFKHLCKLTIAVTSLFLLNPAHALLMLQLDDGSDGSYEVMATDTDGDGQVDYNGGLPNFMVSVQTGLAQPILEPGHLDLISVQVSSLTASKLTVELTDTNQSSTNLVETAAALFGGSTVGGLVGFDFYVDNTNTAFGKQQLIGSFSDLTGPFSSSSSIEAMLGGLYSLTIVANIEHFSALQSSSFNAEIKVPEPGSIALMTAGLLGLFGLRLKKGARA